jgi:beta-lactamase regulating signal transducer with metallopeptidase domain/HEAT repeat protein
VDTPELILLVAKATVLLVAGWAVAALLRRAPAGARHLVWLATLAGLLALPALVRLSPLSLPILPRSESVAGLEAVRPSVPLPRAARPTAEPFAERVPLEAPAPARAVVPWPMLLALLWAAGAALLLARQGLGALHVRRVVRGARPLDDPRWTTLLCEVADRLDVAELPRLVTSAAVDMPFACGFRRATVVLPAAAAEWPDDRRQQVLVHELAHVRRRDLVAHAVARVACAFYWFHPLVWGAARRLRAESERVCDDLVLACGAKASDYAGFLLDVLSSARRPGAPQAAVCMARPRELEGRVLAILDPALRRGQPGLVQRGALVAGLMAALGLVVVTAPADPVAAQDPPSAPEPPSAGVAPDIAVEPDGEEHDDDGKARVARQPASAPVAAGSPDRSALLTRVLRTDPDASVRRSAAWALAHTGGEDAVLVATLGSDVDAEVREMAAWALAESSHADVAAALASALRKDTSDDVRQTAAWALGHVRAPDLQALLQATTDRSSDVRQAALWAIGQQELRQAPPALTTALRDGNPEVRLVAAWALGEIQDPATEPALAAAFSSERDEDVRRALFRALALGNPTPAFIDQALAASDPEIRSRAVMMAAGRGPGPWPWPWPWPWPRPNP